MRRQGQNLRHTADTRPEAWEFGETTERPDLHSRSEVAARHLRADAAALEAQLLARAQEARASGQVTGSGLRMDQGAALHYVLTSSRVAEVLVGPAGSGKTRTLAEAARAWTASGTGDVIGPATAQVARNVLAEAGVELAENSAVFLGHAPGQRGARASGTWHRAR